MSFGVQIFLIVSIFHICVKCGTLQAMFDVKYISQSVWDSRVVKRSNQYGTVGGCLTEFLQQQNGSMDSVSLETDECEIGSLQGNYIPLKTGKKIFVDSTAIQPFPRIGVLGFTGKRVIDLLGITPADSQYDYPFTTTYDHLARAEVLDGGIIYCGGEVRTDCFRHTIGSTTVETVASMRVARKNFVPTIVEMPDGRNRLWVIGGYPTASYQWDDITDTTELFDGTSWEDGPTLPKPLMNPCVVKMSKTRFMIIGGGIPGPGINDKSTFYDFGNPSAGFVETTGNPYTPRFEFTCGKLIWGDGRPRVLAVGGSYTVTQTITNSMEIYDEDADTWTLLSAILPLNIFKAASVVLDNTMYHIGGNSGSSNIRAIYKYTVEQGQWEEVMSDLPDAYRNKLQAFIYGRNV